MRLFFAFLLVSISVTSFAELKNETTLGIVIIDGNAESTTTNLKQGTSYKWDKNTVAAKASLTETEADSVTTAKSWEGSLRYDRALSERISVFTSYLWESNRFAGLLQRETAELGLSYKLKDSDALKWVAELGYSYRQIDVADSDANIYSPGVTLGSEIKWTEREGVTYALRALYRHDLDSDVENHTVEAEPSLSTVLTDIFSLKLAYLVKSQARIAAPATEHTDITFTTNLVANF